MATIKIAPPEHPGWTQEPEDEWNSKVIGSHSQGVMSGPAVKNFGEAGRLHPLQSQVVDKAEGGCHGCFAELVNKMNVIYKQNKKCC